MSKPMCGPAGIGVTKKRPMCGPKPGSEVWKKMITADVRRNNLAKAREAKKTNKENITEEKNV